MVKTVLKWNNEVLKVGGAPMYWDVPVASTSLDVSDNFSGFNDGDLISSGANWIGGNSPVMDDARGYPAVGSANTGLQAAFWDDTFTNNQYSFAYTARTTNSGAMATSVGIVARGSGFDSSLNCYGVRWNGDAANNVQLFSVIDGSLAVIDSSTMTLNIHPTPDKIELRVTDAGSDVEIQVYYEDSLITVFGDAGTVTYGEVFTGAPGVWAHGYSSGYNLVYDWFGGNL